MTSDGTREHPADGPDPRSVDDPWKFIKAWGYNRLHGLARSSLKSNNKCLVCYGTVPVDRHHPTRCPVVEEFGWSLTLSIHKSPTI